MKTFDVGVDVDDVLYPWYDRAHEACVAAGLAGDVQPTSWTPYAEYGVEEAAWLAVLAPLMESGELYAGEPDHDAVRALRRLHWAGHRIHLITTRGTGHWPHADVIRTATLDWLTEYAVPHASVSFSDDKPIAAAAKGVEWFLDDHERNFFAMQLHLHAVGLRYSAPRSFLLDRPWNQHVWTTPCERLHTVDQFVDIILQEAQE